MTGKKHILLVAAVGLFFTSCSVKEERMECPCYVSVRTATPTACLTSFFDPGEAVLDQKMIGAAALTSGDNYTKIRKGELITSVLQNMNSMTLSGGRIVRCQWGQQADPLFAGYTVRKTSADEEMVDVTLQKQNTKFTLILLNSDEEVYPYDISVSAEYNGMDLMTLKGVKGDFLYSPAVDTLKKAEFIITRQANDSPIILSFIDKTTKKTLSVIDINSYVIRTQMYNWDAEYLSDITVKIDFVECKISIQVEDWDEVVIFDFVI